MVPAYGWQHDIAKAKQKTQTVELREAYVQVLSHGPSFPRVLVSTSTHVYAGDSLTRGMVTW